MTITASLVVRLGDGAGDGLLRAEIDAREDGFNQGRTSFRPGDSPHYLVYRGAGVTLTRHVATLGSIAGLGKRAREVEEVVTFADVREVTLGYPVRAGLSVSWMGAVPGTAQLAGDDRLVLPEPGIGVATVTYQTEFDVFRLSNLPGQVNGKTDYSVLVVLIGDVS